MEEQKNVGLKGKEVVEIEERTEKARLKGCASSSGDGSNFRRTSRLPVKKRGQTFYEKKTRVLAHKPPIPGDVRIQMGGASEKSLDGEVGGTIANEKDPVQLRRAIATNTRSKI